MKHTMRFSVGGQVVDVPSDELEQFQAAAAQHGATPDEVKSYRVDDKVVSVPDSEYSQFARLAEVNGKKPEAVHSLQMDDGKTLSLGDNALRSLIQMRTAGNSISRKALQSAGIPDFYGKSVEDRGKLVDTLAEMFPAEKQSLGVLGTLKAQKEAELGREMGYGETLARSIPFLGSILDATEKGKESNERRLYNGEFRDTLEASRLAKAIGVPEEKIREINEEANANATGYTVFGAPINPDTDLARQRYHDLLQDALVSRIQTRAKAGEQLSQNEINFLQKVGVGAVGAGRTIAEMASGPVAAATLGVSAMNRAADLHNGQMTVAANGEVLTSGDDGDTAMLKGFLGATGERLIWMKLGQAAKALPGGGKVADAISKNWLTQNAGEIGGMVVKQRLTNLLDDVVGLNVRDGEEKKALSDWAKDFVSVSSNAEMLLEMLPIHFAMKGAHRLMPSGREAAQSRKAQREALGKYIDPERLKGMSDTDVNNLYRYITSPHLTEERVEKFMSGVAADMKRGGSEAAIDKDINAASAERIAARRAEAEAAAKTKPDGKGKMEPVAPAEGATNETRNGADEAPAKPAEGTAGEPKVGEAADAKAAEPPRAEAPREGVVEQGKSPAAAAPSAETPAQPAENGPTTAPKPTEAQTPTETVKPAEAASRASDAKPVPDGKGRMKKAKKPKAEEPPPAEPPAPEAPSAEGKVEASIAGPQGYSMSGAIFDSAHIAGVKKLDTEHDIVEVLSPPAVNNSGTMYVDVVERKDGKLFGGRYWVDPSTAGDAYHHVDKSLQGGTKDHLQEWLETRYTPQEREAKLREWEGNPAEPPKTPQEPSAEAGQAKETPTAEKPPEAVSAAPDAAPVPDGKGKMKKRKGKKAKAEEPPPPAEEPTAPAETAATEALRETIRTDPELLRIDAAWKTAKTDAERNALKARFDARVEEIKAAQKPAETPAPQAEAPAAEGAAPATTTKTSATETPITGSETPKVVTKNGEVTEVKPPADIDAEYCAMPYEQRVKAQGQYMNAEIAKLEESIKGKFDETKDYRGRHAGWTPKEGVGEVPPTVTVKVPGDGEFKVKNDPDGIAMLKKVAAKFRVPAKKGKAEPTKADVKPPSINIAKKTKAEPVAKETAPFVGDKNRPVGMQKPFTDGSNVYATNGHIMVRRPLRKGENVVNPDAPQGVAHLIDDVPLKNTDKLDVAATYPKIIQSLVTTPFGTSGKRMGGDEQGIHLYRGKDGKVHFRSSDGEGNAYATDDWAKDSKHLAIVNGEYLKTIFEFAAKNGAKEIEIAIGDGNSPLRFKAGEWEGVLMPLRVTERKVAPAAAPKAKGDKRLKSVNPEGDLPDIPDLDAKTPEQEITERLDLKRLDPKRRSDPKVLAWAKKNGRNVTNGMVTPDAVRAYDETMTENTGRLVKRWFPDAKIVAHKYGENIKRGQHVLDLRDTAGRTLGWFDPKSKEVHLLPGADPKAVAHEIMWHGTRDYVSQLAAKGDARAQKWLDMMHDVEQNAPQQIKDIVNRLYARAGQPVSGDTLMNEYGAWATMGKGGAALEKALQKAENRNWFANAFYTVKEMFKDFLTAHGKNRVDLAAIDGMTRDEFVDFLSKEFAGGKTLGHIKGPQQPMISTKETFLGKYKRKVYDQNAAVRDLERDVEKKTGKKISADDSVEAANALKHGLKEAANIEIQGKMAEFRKTLSETGIHHADLEYYAALKAAAGRDAKIDARNIANLKAKMGVQGKSQAEIDAAVNAYKSTNGSHIDPREAKKMLAEIENGPDAAKYKQAYDAMRKVIDETLDVQQQAGLVSAEEVKQWRAEEPNYIPFKNEYDAETGEWLGRGTSRNFTAPEHHAAKGRQSAAGDILAHIFMDHQLAKHRAIENAVRQKLAALVKANPELGKVEILPKDAVRNVEKDDPNVVVFKQNGRAYAIHLEGTRGAAVANAFTQRNQWKMDWADKGFQVYGKKISFRNFAHWSAGMATRYSPTFAVRNTLKDNIELANIIYSERGPIAGSKFMGQYIANRARMAKTLGRYITTGKIDTSTAEGKILDRYIKAGGLIAGGTRAEAFSTIKESISPEAIAKEMKRGNSKIRAVGKHAIKSIAYLNEYAEMATRLGIFSTEVKAGKSDAEAALFSRRATVDFNRHGDYTPGFNLFRLFSNSTLGASARAAAALTKSKYGAVAGVSMFAWGLGRAFLDHFANADEDKERAKLGKATGKDMSEYERRTSLFYFRRGDNLYKVAQHESPFSLITYAGDCVGRWILGEIDGAQVAKNLGVSAAEVAYNFLPMGSVNLTSRNGGFTDDMKAALVSGVCPTVLQPIAELAWNMDYAGRTIYNEPYPGDTSPRSSQGRDSTPDWAKDAAVKLNEATRAEGHRKGYFDIPPEAIQKLLEGYGKNAMRDISMALSVGEAIAKGDLSMLDPRNTPIKRDFVRPLDGNDARFNEARKEFEANRATYKEERKDMTPEERAAYKEQFPHLRRAQRGNELLADIKKLRKMEKGFWYKTGKATPHEWPQEKIDEFKARRRKKQAEFLKLMGEE